MRVLQLCKKSPTPQKDGESIAIHQITKALVAESYEVEVLAMLTSKHPHKDEGAQLEGVQYRYVPINTEINLLDAFFSIFGKVPYIVERFESQNFEKALIEKLEAKQFDIIILEGVFLGIYIDLIKDYADAKLVLRAHNVESQIWKRHANLDINQIKKGFLKLVMNRQFEQFELDVLRKIDAVISISPVDNQFFKKNKVSNTLTVPVCVEQVELSNLPAGFELGFLGGMDWAPNVQGVQWFIQEVWLKFVEMYPDAVFNLAGRNFPLDIKAWKFPGVKIHGEIEDADAFIASQSLIVAPIFSGSGMRVKIIEAMRLGKCVLSTSIGAEGINYEDRKNILLADTASLFLEVLCNLHCERAALQSIGTAAAQLVEKEYSLKDHAHKMHVFLQEL